MSVSFDRAAGYYDETRSLPDDLMVQLVGRLLAELPRDGMCLEIGIGTGRIALPLIQHGVRVVGVDISSEMLGKLIDKAGASAPGVAIADATRLPFRANTFSSAIASHVLHLIPEWRLAVDELLRVVVSGGVILASRSADHRAEWSRRVRRHFFAEAGNPPWPPGIDTIEDLDREMEERRVAVRKIEDVRRENVSTISWLLAALEKGIWSACWSIDAETRRRAAAATREWAKHELGDLDEPRATSHRSDWRAYVVP